MTNATYTSIPARLADMIPRGIERRGLRRSPDSPTPAVIPVNAGKQMAKTSMKESAPSIPLKTPA